MSTEDIRACMTPEEFKIFYAALLDPGQSFALKRSSTRQIAMNSEEFNRAQSRVRYCPPPYIR